MFALWLIRTLPSIWFRCPSALFRINQMCHWLIAHKRSEHLLSIHLCSNTYCIVHDQTSVRMTKLIPRRKSSRRKAAMKARERIAKLFKKRSYNRKEPSTSRPKLFDLLFGRHPNPEDWKYVYDGDTEQEIGTQMLH